VREKPKTIQQQVKSERSARGYSTVKYGQINSSQTVSSPFTKPTNTITVSQLSSPTTTTLKKHNILQFFFKNSSSSPGSSSSLGHIPGWQQ